MALSLTIHDSRIIEQTLRFTVASTLGKPQLSTAFLGFTNKALPQNLSVVIPLTGSPSAQTLYSLCEYGEYVVTGELLPLVEQVGTPETYNPFYCSMLSAWVDEANAQIKVVLGYVMPTADECRSGVWAPSA